MKKSLKAFLYSFWEVAEAVIVAFAVVLIVRSYIVQPFLVSGASMEPSFSSGDYLLVDQLTYRFREPERGEVAVFKHPGKESVYFIKRIIGLPDERVIISGGRVTIFNSANPGGFTLDEEYARPGFTTGEIDTALGRSQYFVLGDNRNFSFDSRSWGDVQRSEIVGIARVRLWPLNRVMALVQPKYYSDPINN